MEKPKNIKTWARHFSKISPKIDALTASVLDNLGPRDDNAHTIPTIKIIKHRKRTWYDPNQN